MAADLPPSPSQPNPGGAIVQPAEPAWTGEAHPDAPKPPSAAWRGVLTKMPEAVGVTAALRNPPILRAFYRIPRAQWPPKRSFELVVVEGSPRRERRIPLVANDPSPSIPPPSVKLPPEDPEVAKRLLIEGHLNINVLALINPPLVPGVYALRIELGPHRSLDLPLRLTP